MLKDSRMPRHEISRDHDHVLLICSRNLDVIWQARWVQSQIGAPECERYQTALKDYFFGLAGVL